MEERFEIEQLFPLLIRCLPHRNTRLFFEEVFNDGAFDLVKEPGIRDEHLIRLRAGEPITLGEQKVVRDGFGVALSAEGEAVVHDPTDMDLAFALSRLSGSRLDHTPIGIFRQVQRPVYDDGVRAQVDDSADDAALTTLLTGPDPWTVR